MSTKSTTPDAWDDDWEALADKQEEEPSNIQVASQQPSKKTSKAERRAQQAEFNKQLWQEAYTSEAPKTFHFLESRTNIPLKSDFKPAVKLLSRKSNQSNSSAPASTNAMDNLKIRDSDSDEERVNEPTMTPEERRLQIQREREEKQRKYDEARGRLFGIPAADSGASSPGNATPPLDGSANKGKGKGKAVGTTDEFDNTDNTRNSSPGKEKKLFDPNYSAKPDSVYVQKREKGAQEEEEDVGVSRPIRQPRQPDGTRGFTAHTRRLSKPNNCW